MFEDMLTYCVPQDDVQFNWAKTGVGFGTFSLYWKTHKGEDGEDLYTLHCDNEEMSKEFVKEMLCLAIDEAMSE